jgi:hypothetical protein
MTRTNQKHSKTASDTAREMLECGLAGMRSYIERTSEEVSETINSDVADAFARVLVKTAQVSAELRKADAEERRRADLNTPEAIIAAIRGLSAREKQTVQGELERMTATRSGLS